MSTEILEVRDVVRSFDGLRAVDEASFHVDQGSITALIGPNGAGKSTLFNVISGFLSAERGTVQFEGRRIDRAVRTASRSGAWYEPSRYRVRSPACPSSTTSSSRQPVIRASG
jgi:ABC-type branched-chain amino acid transport systems, ATPase component